MHWEHACARVVGRLDEALVDRRYYNWDERRKKKREVYSGIAEAEGECSLSRQE
jgi:hypothetical protein